MTSTMIETILGTVTNTKLLPITVQKVLDLPPIPEKQAIQQLLQKEVLARPETQPQPVKDVSSMVELPAPKTVIPHNFEIESSIDKHTAFKVTSNIALSPDADDIARHFLGNRSLSFKFKKGMGIEFAPVHVKEFTQHLTVLNDSERYMQFLHSNTRTLSNIKFNNTTTYLRSQTYNITISNIPVNTASLTEWSDSNKLDVLQKQKITKNIQQKNSTAIDTSAIDATQITNKKVKVSIEHTPKAAKRKVMIHTETPPQKPKETSTVDNITQTGQKISPPAPSTKTQEVTMSEVAQYQQMSRLKSSVATSLSEVSNLVRGISKW